jgi:hypothetical protein
MSFKIAAICTVYEPLSHADVLVTRWLDPHPHDTVLGFIPSTTIASLYVAQRSADLLSLDPGFQLAPGQRTNLQRQQADMAELVSLTYGVPLCANIRAALTLNEDHLAVDAVLLIGEHGDYPYNAFDQKLYPRKELFDEIIAVFREYNQVVPIFCDKHLSWNMAWAQEMLDTVQALDIPFFAGSSAPFAGLQHDLTIPAGANLAESLGVFSVHAESYGFHSLELLQSIIESRNGGETGIASLCAYRGEAVWTAMERNAWSVELFLAAIAAAPTRPGDYRAHTRLASQPPAAFCLEHCDGHRSTHVLLEGHVEDFALAVRLADTGEIRASALNDHNWQQSFVGNFAIFAAAIQQFFLSGRAPVPPERTLFTTLTLATCMQALQQAGQPVLTPHLHLPIR